MQLGIRLNCLWGFSKDTACLMPRAACCCRSVENCSTEIIYFEIKWLPDRGAARHVYPSRKQQGLLHKTTRDLPLVTPFPHLCSSTFVSCDAFFSARLFSFPIHIWFIILWLFLDSAAARETDVTWYIALSRSGKVKDKKKPNENRKLIPQRRWRCGFCFCLCEGGTFCRRLELVVAAKVKWPKRRRNNPKWQMKNVLHLSHSHTHAHLSTDTDIFSLEISSAAAAAAAFQAEKKTDDKWII